jgi:tRNA (guanine37-N1)-methyltransferase
MRLDVITIFPEVVAQLVSHGVIGRAKDSGLIDFFTHNPRQFSDKRFGQIDDRPFGGGPGMIFSYEPIARSLAAIRTQGQPDRVIYVSPQGLPFTQRLAEALRHCRHLVFICGRYEGIDERLQETIDLELSIGDFVVSGGELPAMLMMDAIVRLLPGVLKHPASAQQDSFAATGLLDCPHYTRPETLPSGQSVPKVLLQGDHQAIARWRLQQALLTTWRKRPELLLTLPLSDSEKKLLQEAIANLLQEADLPQL